MSKFKLLMIELGLKALNPFDPKSETLISFKME